MAMIDITNVINVSVQIPPAGLAPYSVNNLVCFTKDTPVTPISGGYAVYSSPSDVGEIWGITSNVYKAAAAVFSQSPNILTGGGLFIVVPMLNLETLDEAIVRAKALAYFGGFSYTYTLGTGEALDAAAVAEAERKLFFLTSSDPADLIGPSGLFADIQLQSLKHSRCLWHSVVGELASFRWAYAGRGMSVNFAASNTTLTMQLKQLTGVSPDSGLTQTNVTNAKTVGADVYANIAGRASVLSHGANGFFDDVYNLDWFVGALQVGGFNYLATTSTKIPQTEAGMDGLKGAFRNICGQGVANAFIAPGSWTSADTFGNPEDFKRNITDFGYFIYSSPVATQNPADRALRKAVPIQIAIKYAGAIHTSDVIVYINQ
jgi:hypothetical protein